MYKKIICKIEKIIQTLLLGLIKVYQYMISPVLGCSCRFYPTCSYYAQIALKNFGVIRGVYLIIWRLLRCHPFNPGGVDFLPKKSNESR